MKIKAGDTVKVIAGKDRGKTGKVVQALPALNRVSVEGVNMLSKHLRSGRTGQQGQKIEFASPIQISNVMLVCPQCGKPTRVGIIESKEGEKSAKTRACKKCNTALS